MEFFIYFFLVNIFAYLLMWIDKIRAIYQYWRISERTLWIVAGIGGVFGIWFGMSAPLYHKAGKRVFRIGIPILAIIWIVIAIFFLFVKIPI